MDVIYGVFHFMPISLHAASIHVKGDDSDVTITGFLSLELTGYLSKMLFATAGRSLLAPTATTLISGQSSSYHGICTANTAFDLYC